MRMLTTPLPRALQVGIWALSTPTKTPEYPLAQNSILFLVVPVAFAESWVVKIVGDRSVSGTRCGRAQGGSLRGLFWDYMLFCCIVIIVWCGVFVTPPAQNVGIISISLTTRSCHFVQSSPLDAIESVKLSSDLPDRFWEKTAFILCSCTQLFSVFIFGMGLN
jgi:hypothetical protein